MLVKVKKSEHDISKVTCYHCSSKGHYARECPKRMECMHTNVANDKDEQQDDEFSLEHVFHQSGVNQLNKDWLLLVNKSILDHIVNPAYIKNIWTVKQLITMFCNTGSTANNQKGSFEMFDVWYNPNGIANVLSLKAMTEHYQVTYDGGNRGRIFVIHLPAEMVEFIWHSWGLHHLDLSNMKHKDIFLAIMLEERYVGYTKHQLDGAIKAYPLQEILEHLSQQDFEEMVHERMIRNYPVIPYEVANAYSIFCHDHAGVRGKTVRHKSEWIEWDYVGMAKYIIEMNKEITLMVDIMFIKQVPFVITYWRRIRLVTVEWIPNLIGKKLAINLKKCYNYIHGLDSIYKLY